MATPQESLERMLRLSRRELDEATNRDTMWSPPAPIDFASLRREKLVGTGAFAEVYLANYVDGARQIPVAIKQLRKSFISRNNKTASVMREKEGLRRCTEISSLDHSSATSSMRTMVTRLFATHQDASNLYFVLEYCPYGDLQQKTARFGSLSPKCTQYYTAQLVEALCFLFDRSIVHRDLKPENVMLTANGAIRLADFACCRMLNKERLDAERANTFVGTPEYVAPEVIENEAATFASDLWSLGCIVFYLLTGMPPFASPEAAPGSHAASHIAMTRAIAVDYAWPQPILDACSSSSQATGPCKDTSATELGDESHSMNPSSSPSAAALIKRLVDLATLLLRRKPQERLGDISQGGPASLRLHSAFEDVAWHALSSTAAPAMLPHIPGIGAEPLKSPAVTSQRPATSAQQRWDRDFAADSVASVRQRPEQAASAYIGSVPDYAFIVAEKLKCVWHKKPYRSCVVDVVLASDRTLRLFDTDTCEELACRKLDQTDGHAVLMSDQHSAAVFGDDRYTYLTFEDTDDGREAALNLIWAVDVVLKRGKADDELPDSWKAFGL